MNARSAAALSVGVTIVAIVVAAGGQGGTPAPSETQELKQQIGALEKRVAALEERLRQQPPGGALVIPPTGLQAPAPALPKGWQQRDFNGMAYYLVPAQAARELPATPAK